MKSAEWPARTAWWTRFLVSIVLPRPWLPTRTTFSPLADEVEREDAVDGRAVELLGPVPLEVGDRFEAAEAGRAQAPFESAPRALVEFGLDERFEQDQRTPAFLRGAGDQVVEVLGGVRQARAAAG